MNSNVGVGPISLTSPYGDQRNQKFIFLCHDNFPNAVWSYNVCVCAANQLANLQGYSSIGQDLETTIIVGCVMIRYTTQKTMYWLKNSLFLLRRSLNCPVILLTQEEFPDFYAIHLNLPSVSSCIGNVIIQTLCYENPNLNCHLWNVVYRAQECHFDHLIMRINKKCFDHFDKVKNVINFKSTPIIAPLEFYEKSIFYQEPNVVHKFQGMINQMYCQYMNYLLNTGCSLAESQESAVTSINNYKQIIENKSDLIADVKPQENRFDETKVLDNPTINILKDKYVFISKNDFPKSFLTNHNSLMIMKGLHFFHSYLVTKPAISDIVLHVGWLKIYYGNENAFKTLETLIALVSDPRNPLRLIPNDEISDFNLISFTIPTSGCLDDILLQYLIRKNETIDFSSWLFIKREYNKKMEKFLVTMNSQSFNSLKNNMFEFQFKSVAYKVNVLTGLGLVCPITNTLFNIESEYLKYLNHLLDIGVSSNEAQIRAIGALENYQIMILPKNSNASFFLHKPICFNDLFTKNIYESLQLIDEISTQLSTTGRNKFVILCNYKFPKIFLMNLDLNILKKGLTYFLDRFPVRPAVSNIVKDDGWLKIYYGNDAALRILLKFVEIINIGKPVIQLIKSDQIPEFKCLVWSPFTSKRGSKETILENLKNENIWFDVNKWSIAKLEKKCLFITMDQISFTELENYSFYVIYKSKRYLIQPKDIHFAKISKSGNLANLQPIIEQLNSENNNEVLKGLSTVPRISISGEKRSQLAYHHSTKMKKLKLKKEQEGNAMVLESREDSKRPSEIPLTDTEEIELILSQGLKRDECRSKGKVLSSRKDVSRLKTNATGSSERRKTSDELAMGVEESSTRCGDAFFGGFFEEDYFKLIKELKDISSLLESKTHQRVSQVSAI